MGPSEEGVHLGPLELEHYGSEITVKARLEDEAVNTELEDGTKLQLSLPGGIRGFMPSVEGTVIAVWGHDMKSTFFDTFTGIPMTKEQLMERSVNFYV